MTVGVILQPSYIPWRGYFHQIARADVFVFYDDVQYDRRGWRNRNRIKTAQGPQWLTVPVRYAPRSAQIQEILIDYEQRWVEHQRRAFELAYAAAPHAADALALLDASWEQHPDRLADLTIDLTTRISRYLGLDQVQFLRSSELAGIEGAKTDRLVAICQRLGLDHYLSGPSAANYIEPAVFQQRGIQLEYMTYNYPEYPQLHGAFDAFLSIVDLIAMVGTDAGGYIWGEPESEQTASPTPVRP